MVRIPEATVEEIRQSTDIVDVISQYLQLKKSGQNHFAHCPFHEDKTPSFSVNSQKQIFYCFSCGTGGNVFNFLREMEGLSYPEAIIRTAELTHYPLDQNMVTQVLNQSDQFEDSTTGKLYSINKLAKRFYHHILMNTQIGKPALDYLLERGLDRETLVEFELGFSPPQRNALSLYLTTQEDASFEAEVYEQSGLFSANNNPTQNDFLDRFTNRIMFPIQNERGHVIGFSGRIFQTPGDEAFQTAKYLNTPETTLFNKSAIIYNFDKAKSAIRRENEAIIFEGYMDVISAWQAGVKNGIASMGTSLTDDQIKAIDRFTDHIVLAFDGDDAGFEAIHRSASYISNNTHFDLDVVSFPRGMDPDDYIQKNGAQAFKEFLKNGRDTYMSFLMQFHRRNKNLANESDQIEYIDKVLIELVNVDPFVEREIYINQLSEEFNLSTDTLKSQFETVISQVQQKQMTDLRQQQVAKYDVPTLDIQHENKKKLTLVEQAERMLLNRLFYHEEAWFMLNKSSSDFYFMSEDHQLIYILFSSYRENDLDSTDIEGFLDYLQEDHLKRKVAEIFLIELGDLTESEINDYVNVIQNVSPVKETIARKTEELREAQRLGNIAMQQTLVIEIINLNKKLKNNQNTI